MKVLQETQL